jgi:hypothetical protein
MKKLLIVFVILISVVSAFAAFGTPQTEKEIQSIRQSYAAINRNQARYRKVKKELSGFSAEGGELLAYFDGPAIVKMIATFYGEGGKSYEEYYYREGKLIFVLRKESRYSRPLSGRVISIKLNRFYFHDDKLVRWIDPSGKLMRSDSAEYQEEEKDYLDTSKQFIDGARSSKTTIESNQ